MSIGNRSPFVAGLLAAVLVAGGCNSTLPTTESLPPRAPGSQDAGAGNWKMLVMSGPTQIAVAPPAAVTSDAYQAELAAIKASQAAMTDAQRQAIDYWGGGAVLRWNQILRELVAKYNLPPAPRPNGTYPAPDADNPFADPAFPFSNPPYAARAYSYVSVAQFEALKAAWHYKFQYNRPAPSRVDSGVKALATADLPAYPSEDAVLSGVSTEMMRLLLPAAVEEITRKAGEEREAALLSGKASASDIAAGLALGRAVAALFVARAATDGMRNAVGTRAQWDAFAAAAVAKGEIPWVSLDAPSRPPMLPFFGAVVPWAMTAADIAMERPAPPPSTSSAQMRQELAEVRHYTDSATREEVAIAHKWSDGAGTYSPPGHWNDIAAEYVRDANWSEVRSARAFALLNMAVHDADHARPRRQDRDRLAELPGLHVRALHVLRRRRGRAQPPLPRRHRGIREGRTGSEHVQAVRVHALPLGHRGGQGARHPDRRLHGALREGRRRRLSVYSERRTRAGCTRAARRAGR